MPQRLWMSVGYAPANALLHQAGARFRYDVTIAQIVPAELPEGAASEASDGRAGGVARAAHPAAAAASRSGESPRRPACG